jgi:hypothetical protein
MKETTEVKTSILMKKLRLQYAICFGRQEKTVLRTKLKTFKHWQKCVEVGGDYVEKVIMHGCQ